MIFGLRMKCELSSSVSVALIMLGKWKPTLESIKLGQILTHCLVCLNMHIIMIRHGKASIDGKVSELKFKIQMSRPDFFPKHIFKLLT